MLLIDASTSCIYTMCAWVNQGKRSWCFTLQEVKASSVTISAISCKNHTMRRLWCDFSWTLTMKIHEMQRFAIRVVKYCKVACRPLTKEFIVLCLEYSKHWPSCSSLCELDRLVYMSTFFRWSAWLVGGLQTFIMVRKILRMTECSSKLRFRQFHFTTSRIVAGFKVGSLAVL